MYFTGDPSGDYARYDAEMEDRLKMLPVCDCCGEHIQQEKAIYYNGQWCCEECESDFWQDIREDFLESVEDDG